MSITEPQKRALANAIAALSEVPDNAMALRLAIRDIIAAFQDELGDDDEEPVPPALIQAAKNLFTRPVADHRPGGCECGGHVDASGVFHAAVAS